MAHAILLVEFCLLLPNVIALQTSSTDLPHTFVTSNNMFCAQAPKSIASDALNLYKSMPRGKLYDGSELSTEKSCEVLGYKHSAGEDPCYPGLKTFYRSQKEGEQFYNALQGTLKEFGESKDLSLDDANLVDSCTCKDHSYAKNYYGKNCDKALELYSHNPVRVFVTLDKMFCAQASRAIAFDALNLYKSMPRGKLFAGIKLGTGKGCEELGYKLSAGEDPCYPGLMTFFHSKKEGEKFYDALQSAKKEWGEKKNLTLDDVNFMELCRCKDKSYARSGVMEWYHKECES